MALGSRARAPAPHFSSPFANLEHSQERFLRDINSTDALHALLAFLLLFEQFALSRDVAAVAFGEHVLAHGRHGLARNYLRADCGLNRHFEHLTWNQFLHFGRECATA